MFCRWLGSNPEQRVDEADLILRASLAGEAVSFMRGFAKGAGRGDDLWKPEDAERSSVFGRPGDLARG